MCKILHKLVLKVSKSRPARVPHASRLRLAVLALPAAPGLPGSMSQTKFQSVYRNPAQSLTAAYSYAECSGGVKDVEAPRLGGNLGGSRSSRCALVLMNPRTCAINVDAGVGIESAGPKNRGPGCGGGRKIGPRRSGATRHMENFTGEHLP